jgi:hypothetical protein
MGVKLINSDAKDFFGRFVCELANSLAEIEMKIPHGAPVPESLQRMLQEIERGKLGIKSEILANDALWKESDEFPKLIRFRDTGSNGDWNGNKLGAVSVSIIIRGKLILFKNALFDVTGLYTPEEAKLLVQKNYEAERSEIDFLKSRSDKSSEKSKTGREPIPERIRNEVWRRDGGKCVECSSVYNLEFDHVIPVAKGGSNTARNLRILCEPCNRRKSDSIG